MRRVRSSVVQSVGRLALAVRGYGAADEPADVRSIRGTGASAAKRRQLVGLVATLVAFAAGAPATALAGEVHAYRADLSQTPATGLTGQICGAVTDSHGYLYVVSRTGNKVSIFDPAGAPVTSFTAGVNACGLAVDDAGNVYASTASGVVKYAPAFGVFPPTAATTYAPDTSVNLTGTLVVNSNGVAVDPVGQQVYATVKPIEGVQTFARNGATGGTFRLCKGDAPAPPDPAAQCTAAIPVQTAGAGMATALASLYGAGNVVGGGLAGAATKTLRFTGALAGAPVPLMWCDGSALTGGSPPQSCTVTQTTAPVPSHVSVYETDGTLVDDTLGASLSTPTAGANFYGVDVHGVSGDVFVTDASSNRAYVLDGDDGSVERTMTGADAPDGGFGSLADSYLAVDQSDGSALISDVASHGVVDDFDPAGNYQSRIGPEFGGGLTLQKQAGIPLDVAVDNGASSPNPGMAYVTSSNGSVYAFAPSAPPLATTAAPTGVTQTTAILRGSVTPNGTIIECRFEWGPAEDDYSTGSTPCAPAPGSGSAAVAVSGSATGLTPHDTYHYRVVIINPSGTAYGIDRAFVASAPPAATTAAATAVEATTATVNASVDPAGGVGVTCSFEYGPTTGYGATAPCEPDPGTATGPVPVSADLTGLAATTTYHYRVRLATDGGEAVGDDRTFVTPGPPVIARVVVDAQADTATITAMVNPNRRATQYYLEWGETAAYGRRTPTRSVGGGDEPVPVNEMLDHLTPGTTYRFRFVATNAVATTTDDDRSLVTDRDDALFGDRVPEMVSVPDKGVHGWVGVFAFGTAGQPSLDGERAMYPVAGGLPDATTMSEVPYGAARGSDGWTSTQMAPPAAEQAYPGENTSNGGGTVKFVPDDISCSLVESSQQLTDDPLPEIMREYGSPRLYRRDADGHYTLMLADVPLNPSFSNAGGRYFVVGASSDCRRVIFRTDYRYAGLNGSGLYQVDHGVLRDVAVRPDGSAATGVDVGGSGTAINWRRSANGSWVFFDATSNDGNDAGRPALYLRRNGDTTKVSASKTSVVNQRPHYQVAARDGSRALFLANYGLAPNDPRQTPTATDCSGDPPRPCALYLYDVANDTLRSISATADPGNIDGEKVAGVVDASDDLSRIYFATQGRLAGQGRSYAHNVADATYNLYLWTDDGGPGAIALVATVTHEDLVGDPTNGEVATGGNLIRQQVRLEWRAQSAPDGRHLLFSSRADVIGYPGGAQAQAYLYDADTATVRCLSCRRDGAPSVGDGTFEPLRNLSDFFAGTGGGVKGATTSRPRSLSDDGRYAFFDSPDVLAPGAIPGQANIYEWDDGRLRLLVTGPQIAGSTLRSTASPKFDGISASGRDAFIRTTASFDPRDTDEAMDLYDFRLGGRPARPIVMPPICAPLDDGCQGSGASPSAVAPPASSAPSGDGNAASAPRGALRVKRLSAAQRRRLSAGRRVRMLVTVNQAGRVSLRGTVKIRGFAATAMSASRSAPRAGAVALALRLTPAARREVRRRGRLALRLEVRFSQVAKAAVSTVALRAPGGRGARHAMPTRRIGGRS